MVHSKIGVHFYKMSIPANKEAILKHYGVKGYQSTQSQLAREYSHDYEDLLVNQYVKSSFSVAFCPSCYKRFNTGQSEDFTASDDLHEMTCMHCGEENLYKKSSHEFTPNRVETVYKGITFSTDYKRIYLNIHYHTTTFFNNHMQIYPEMTRVVINFSRGMATALKPLIEKENPLLVEERSKYIPPPKLNILYDFSLLTNYVGQVMYENRFKADILNEFKPFFFEVAKKYLPYDIEPIYNGLVEEKSKHVANIYKDTHSLGLMILSMRFHSVPNNLLELIKGISRVNRNSELGMVYRTLAAQIPFVSRNQSKAYFDLFKDEYKKMAKKMGFKDVILYSFIEPYFKNKDNAKLFCSVVGLRTVGDRLVNEGLPALKRGAVKKNPYTLRMPRIAFTQQRNLDNLERVMKFKDLIQDLYKENLMKSGLKEEKALLKAESLTVRKIVKDNPSESIMIDAYRSYSRIVDEYGMTVNIETSWSCKRIHDYISSTLDKIRRPSQVIAYSEESMKLNEEINGYKFTLAPDTHVLIDMGKTMNICVGGYDRQAVSGSSTIVRVSSERSEYECCIELRKGLSEIRQAKIAHNQFPQGKLLASILDWVKKHNIEIQTSDLGGDFNKEPEDINQNDDNHNPRQLLALRNPRARLNEIVVHAE